MIGDDMDPRARQVREVMNNQWEKRDCTESIPGQITEREKEVLRRIKKNSTHNLGELASLSVAFSLHDEHYQDFIDYINERLVKNVCEPENPYWQRDSDDNE